LTIIQRDAPDFDEEAAMAHVQAMKEKPAETMACGCPSSMLRVFDAPPVQPVAPIHGAAPAGPAMSRLGQWPVQLRLLPPSGALYKDKHLVLVADCVAVAFPALHERLLAGNTMPSPARSWTNKRKRSRAWRLCSKTRSAA
jgi:hypothetical protein